MSFTQLLKKYAELAVRSGVNIQKDQYLLIKSPIECAEFARHCMEAAYKAGAKDVAMEWADEQATKLRYTYASDEILATVPDYIVESRMYYQRKGGGLLAISASDPDLFADVDPKKMQIATRALSEALTEHRTATMTNQIPWCVVSVPTVAWAKKVFPDASGPEAVEKLWNAIFKAARVNEPDPVAAWKAHTEALEKRIDFLNNARFSALRYANSLGTDVTVGLADGHLWCGGASNTLAGVPFIANMPTEEVFTTPHMNRIDGVVKSALPLNYKGTLIDEFTLRFEKGRVVDFSAKKGQDALKGLLEIDPGACSLGEVALIPYASPISQMGILFYNTLYDENASCHFAFGKSYPSCMENGAALSKEELAQRGANDSLIHEDFMIGTSDLSITGITQDGKEIPLFKEGNWAF